MKKFKKLLAGFMTLAMLVTMLPATVFAGDDLDTSWYNSTDTEFTLMDAADLAGLAKLVDEGNSFAGKTVELGADIDLYVKGEGDEPVSFDPIGDDSPFSGTFDGQNHTIKNLYQSGWAFGYEWGSYGSIGLFGELESATVKNLTISGAECFVEGGDVGGITGSATGTCVFENITIEDSVFATYNNGNGGIIGWSGAGNYTFKDIEIADDVVLAGLWGSFDSSIGGIVGQAEPGATYNFEDVDIACRIDAYNDCTASYDYYNYRMCGMIMGRLKETTKIDGVNYPDTSKYNITCKDVTVTYGDWMNYHYCDPTPGYNNGRGMRVESGYSYDGLPADYDHSQCTTHCKELIPFDQIFGGAQYGVTGLKTYDGVTVDYSKAAVAKIDNEYFLTLADAVEEAVDGDTIVLLADANFVNTSKTLTFKGATGEEKLTLGQAYGTHSEGMTFEDLTMIWTNENYKGLQHIGKETYINCVIEGQPFLYGEESVFEKCTFNQTSADAYNVWTYGSKDVTFTECTFNSAGKSVLIYNEGATDTKATFEDCKFKASKAVEGKAGIEIDSSFSNFEVTITECTMKGFADGSVSGQPRWNIKKPEITNTVIDGTKTTYTTGSHTVIINEVLEPVAEIVDTGVKYADLQEALNACTNGEIVKLIKDITYTEDDVVYAHGGATGFGNYDKYNPCIIYTGGTKGATAAENKPSEVNAVIDLNGHSITNNADAYLFLIMDNAVVTFKDSKGGGSINTTTEDYPMIWAVGTDTKVTVESGKYVAEECECILNVSHGADMFVTGGMFEAADGASQLILRNEYDRKNPNYFIDGNATVTVSGGDFVGFNPENTPDDSNYPGDTYYDNVVADGYVSTLLKDGKTYRVHKEGTEAEPVEPTPSTSSSKKSKKYDVEIEDTEDGTVKASSTRAKRGATVTLTVTPDDGYELDKIVVLDSDGDKIELTDKGNGKFTFTMPRGDVEVEVSFAEEDKDASADEQKEIILTIGQKIAWVFDEYVMNDVAPEIVNDRTMLPIRFVVEALGGSVAWDEPAQKVTITMDETVIEIFIGQAFATVNGSPVQLDASAYIANDRTYLPLRFVAENLGATVTWDEVTQKVTIIPGK